MTLFQRLSLWMLNHAWRGQHMVVDIERSGKKVKALQITVGNFSTHIKGGT